MNELIVPPAPNWFFNSILTCTPDNTIIYGARNSIVILQDSEPSVAAGVKIIYQAHNDKVTAVAVCNAAWDNPDKFVVSVSADRIVKLWNTRTSSLVNQHKEHERYPDKVMGVFMLRERVVSVSENGYIIVWRLATNSCASMPDIFGQKVRIRCMSSCPHTPWRTAFGLVSGLVIVADLRQNGRVLYRMRGNEAEITSLSWSPAAFNVFRTPRGIAVENSLSLRTYTRNKYIDEQPDKQGRSNKLDGRLRCPVAGKSSGANTARMRSDGVVDRGREDVDTSLSELEREQHVGVLSNESFKNIITSGENGDLDDAPAATNLEYKPKQRKRNVRKQKVDKKNPWGNVEFNNSDDEEQTDDGRACYLPAVTDDFLGECLNLRNIILREESAEMTEKETSSQREETEENRVEPAVEAGLKTAELTEAEVVQEEKHELGITEQDGAGGSQIPEQKETENAEEECVPTEEKGITERIEDDVGGSQIPEQKEAENAEEECVLVEEKQEKGMTEQVEDDAGGSQIPEQKQAEKTEEECVLVEEKDGAGDSKLPEQKEAEKTEEEFVFVEEKQEKGMTEQVEDGAGDSKIPEQKETEKTEEECVPTEEKHELEITEQVEDGADNSQIPEQEAEKTEEECIPVEQEQEKGMTEQVEDGAGGSKITEQKEADKTEEECVPVEEKQETEITEKEETAAAGSDRAQCSEVERKLAEVVTLADETISVPAGDVNAEVACSLEVACSTPDVPYMPAGDVNVEVACSLEVACSTPDVPYAPGTEYLLASACKNGIICIWRAGTDGRLQRQLHVNKGYKNQRSQRRTDKNSRWVALCWVKPDVLVSSSFAHEVFAWNLLPDVQDCKAQSRETVYKPRLIHSDHKRIVFTLASPYKGYSYEDHLADCSDAYVWSMAQDRWLFCTSLEKDRRMLACYPTLGSLVLNLAVSPVDPNKIAIGVGDSSMRLWDLSKPHTRVVSMICLWDKIKSKVLHLDWHPKKENFVAFATAEGRVGEFDAFSVSKPPTVFANYHTNPVFRVQWGPLPSCTDGIYGLYSSSNGELVVHDASKPTIEPSKVELPKCNVSTFAWKADYSVLAVGTKEGDVWLLSPALVPYRTLYMQRKSVQYLAWHPLSTVVDVGLSPFANDLAVGTNDSDILVYRCDEPGSAAEDETKAQLVAVLHGHTQRVKVLCWCPHLPARLASCSEDTTAIVWDVSSQTVIATFNDHCNDVIMSILWSPLDADLILTGGKDNTLRVWRITKNPPNPLSVTDMKVKKKATKPARSVAVPNEAAGGGEKTPKVYILPCVTRMQHPDHGFLMNTFHKLLHQIDHPEDTERKPGSGNEDDSSSEDEPETFPDIGMPRFKIDPAQLFGSKDDTVEILEFERHTHMAKKRWDCAHHIALYKGDIGRSIRTALQTGAVNPWIISIAPMVSIRLWMKLCMVYAEKLADKGDGLTAASYFLAVHQPDRAVHALCKANLFREALSLAKVRFQYDVVLIADILEQWAKYAIHNGTYEIAAQCYICLGKFAEAGKWLNNRTDAESLMLAADLARRGGNQDLCDAVHAKLAELRKAAAAEVPEVVEATPPAELGTLPAAEGTVPHVAGAAAAGPLGGTPVMNISNSRFEAVFATCWKMLGASAEKPVEDTGTSSSSSELD